MNINYVNLVGNIGNIDIKNTKGGNPFVVISLATNKYYTDAEGKKTQKRQWHNLSIFKPYLVDVAKKLVKGNSITIIGELEYSNWESDEDKKSQAKDGKKDENKSHKSAYILVSQLAKIDRLNDKDDSDNETTDEHDPI